MMSLNPSHQKENINSKKIVFPQKRSSSTIMFFLSEHYLFIATGVLKQCNLEYTYAWLMLSFREEQKINNLKPYGC